MRRLLAVLVLSACLCPRLAATATCEDWVATMVSAQGTIEARRAGETQWLRMAVGDRYCPGDSIRVQDRSRAAVLLRNEAVLRLDQNTTITLTVVKDDPASWVDLLRGIVHFLSRLPRGLKVVTPFVNGTVEGTEFVFDVAPDRAILTVLEGRVAAENSMGRLTVESGQAVIARLGQSPTLLTVVRPGDAVQWALYYPSILDYRTADFPDIAGEDWPARVRRSIEAYRKGDLASAFASLEGARADILDPRFFTYRAVLLLSVGRVEEGRSDIAGALGLDPKDGQALALQSLIAVVQNEKDQALRLAQSAVESSPASAGAWIALSYARQASFDLDGARQSLQEAVKLDPQNATAHARLAEIWLSFGKVREALAEATEAARLSPDHARTQTVQGFTYLAQLKTKVAQEAFQRAIALDPADPLPRLGLGLARIRAGDLDGGRREIEIAAALDPGNSLVRSYLGKAYYEEKRDAIAVEEFGRAKTLDPNDPTPWFYDAIEKQSVNRPVEALQDLQRAIELNDNRAVYRSRLLLDEDLAARSANLARIYDDLGFQKLALVEGWKSVNTDPTNNAAHRFLADSYFILPRHEIARVSELLQAQLLQPLNLNPVPPQSALARSLILTGTAPASPSFNEFNSLFNRNGLSFQASGVVGGNGIFGEELLHAGLWNNVAYSLGQFHYETTGFRTNSALNQNLYNGFVQADLTRQTSLQAEFRLLDVKKGDLDLRFDPANFFPEFREKDRVESVRGGFRHSFAPDSIVIGSFIYQWDNADFTFGPGTEGRSELNGFTAETQHLYRGTLFSTIAGVGHNNSNRKDTLLSFDTATTDHITHTNGYLYTHLDFIRNLIVTIGGSLDSFRSEVVHRDQVNPKFGITWNVLPSTTVRAAVFRTLNRTLTASQTLEPTQVAGFNQFFDDGEGVRAWRYGVGADQKFSKNLFAGVEQSWRDLKVPAQVLFPEPSVVLGNQKEQLSRAYVYWTPRDWLALSVEYQYERFKREPDFSINFEDKTVVKTHRVPLGVNVFAPWGLMARLKATYIDQRGDFADSTGTVVQPGGDRFWVLDAAIGYRLPKRLGLITLEARNLLNQHFKFQDTDPANPSVSPGRLILGKVTLAY